MGLLETPVKQIEQNELLIVEVEYNLELELRVLGQAERNILTRYNHSHFKEDNSEPPNKTWKQPFDWGKRQQWLITHIKPPHREDKDSNLQSSDANPPQYFAASPPP